MKAQLCLLAVLLTVALAGVAKSSDLASAESGPIYDYYPAPHGGHSSGHSSHGHLSKGHDSHGHGHYDDHVVDDKSGYGKHGSHAVSSYDDHGAHGAHGGHDDHYGKKSAYVKNSGSGYEKSYSYDKQVHLHDIDSHKSAHHDNHADHGHHGYKNAGHYDQHGHKLYGAHDKHGSYGYGNSGHLKSDHGHQSYDKHDIAKPVHAITYGSGHYGPVAHHSAPVYLPKVAVPAPVYIPKTIVQEHPVYAHKPVVPVYQPKVAIPIYGHKSSGPGYHSYQY